MGIFSRLFSFLGPSSTPAAAAKTAPPRPAAAQQPRPAAPPPITPAILTRREGLGADGGIALYLLEAAPLRPEDRLDGHSVLHTLSEANPDELAARLPIILPLTLKQWQGADFAPLIGPQTHIQLKGLSLQSSPAAIRDWVAAIRAQGARIAVDDALTPMLPVLLEVADLLLVDVACQTMPVLERKLAGWKAERPDLALLATNIGTWAEHRLFLSRGFTFGMGNFTSEAESRPVETGVSESRAVVLEMLNALRRDAELTEVIAIAKRDPAVVVRLLARVNSPIYGLGRDVSGLDEVVMILGREPLYRWLAVVLFSLDGESPRDQTLLFLALCRATLLERLAGSRGPQASELFLVGLLSLADSLMGLPQAELAAKIRLPDNVAAALLHRSGPHAGHLALAEALERSEVDKAVDLAASLGIDSLVLSAAYRDAVAVAFAAADSVA